MSTSQLHFDISQEIDITCADFSAISDFLKNPLDSQFPPSGSEYMSSPSSYLNTFSFPQSEDLSPPPTRSKRPRSKKPSSRSKPANHIPRPRNAFLIYRSCKQEQIAAGVEADHRIISRIIGHCWNKLPEEEKNTYREMASQEKAEHMKKYPNYRFTPNAREKKPLRRKTKRNGAEDMLRCVEVAELLLDGKEGHELEEAVKRMKPISRCSKDDVDTNSSRTPSLSPESSQSPSVGSLSPPFRSPLLPPNEYLYEPTPQIYNQKQVSTNSSQALAGILYPGNVVEYDAHRNLSTHGVGAVAGTLPRGEQNNNSNYEYNVCRLPAGCNSRIISPLDEPQVIGDHSPLIDVPTFQNASEDYYNFMSTMFPTTNSSILFSTPMEFPTTTPFFNEEFLLGHHDLDLMALMPPTLNGVSWA